MTVEQGSITEREFLIRVRAILVAAKIIREDQILCRESWLDYYRSGFDAKGAVMEDMGYMPSVRWSRVAFLTLRFRSEFN